MRRRCASVAVCWLTRLTAMRRTIRHKVTSESVLRHGGVLVRRCASAGEGVLRHSGVLVWRCAGAPAGSVLRHGGVLVWRCASAPAEPWKKC